MIPEQFVYLGALFNVIASVVYLIATIKGHVQPNRVSFFLWALASLIAFSAQIQQGIGIQALLSFSAGFGPLLIFIASFFNKKSIWQLTHLDVICGILSLCGIILWVITQVGNVAIVFSLLADGLASLPTIVKSYKAPHTENRLAYLLSSISGLLTICTITNWDFATYSFPIYLFIINLIIVLILQLRTKKVK